MNERLGVALAVLVGCVVALGVVVRRHASQPPQVASRVVNPGRETTTVETAPVVAPLPQVEPTPAVSPPRLPPPKERHPVAAPKSKTSTPPAPVAPIPAPPQTANAGGGGGGGQKNLVNPVAREALSYVGVDPAAEAVWASAINDPTVPADERKDLIEDLNEDGFPDPKHITQDDLPLIASRIALIEQAAPLAMDDVNADAFQEAYKDLTNMVAKLQRQ